MTSLSCWKASFSECILCRSRSFDSSRRIFLSLADKQARFRRPELLVAAAVADIAIKWEEEEETMSWAVGERPSDPAPSATKNGVRVVANPNFEEENF